MLDLIRVAIVGRPNVGKSTLFNRIVRARVSIVEPTKSVTRDRIYRTVEWDGVNFILIDTGGIIISEDIESLYKEVKKQSLKAIREADVAILLVDAQEGLHPLDEEIAQILRKERKVTILAVNKVDNEEMKSNIAEFQKLGIKDVIAISALHGLWTNLLLDKVKEYIGVSEVKICSEAFIKVAIIGRPNVGKSSYLNALLNEERVVVDASPGTTRDAVDTYFSYRDKKFILIDTAGIRHKRKLKSAIDYFSSVRTNQAIERADLVLFMIDGWEGIRRDDLSFIYRIWKRGKGLVLAINKRDLIQRSITEYEKLIRKRLTISEYLPIVYISAKERYNLIQAILVCLSVYENLGRHIKTSDLNKLIGEIKSSQPKIIKGKRILKILSSKQKDIFPPQIEISVNYPELVTENLINFLERRIRLKFGFMGAPIKLVFRREK